MDSVQAWINEPTDADRRASRARVVAARRGRSGAVEVPPYVVQAPEYVTRWGAVEPPVGTVIRWTVEGATQPSIIMRDRDGWGAQGLGWADVVDLVKNRPAAIATSWVDVPVAPEPESGDDAVRSWASQFLADSGPQVSEHTDSPIVNG